MPSPRYLYKDTELKAVLKNMVMLVDTWEKRNEHIITHFEQSKIQYQPYALSFGDYSVMLPEMPGNGIMRSAYFDKSIAIERKANLDKLTTNIVGREGKTTYYVGQVREIIVVTISVKTVAETVDESEKAVRNVYGGCKECLRGVSRGRTVVSHRRRLMQSR